MSLGSSCTSYRFSIRAILNSRVSVTATFKLESRKSMERQRRFPFFLVKQYPNKVVHVFFFFLVTHSSYKILCNLEKKILP